MCRHPAVASVEKRPQAFAEGVEFWVVVNCGLARRPAHSAILAVGGLSRVRFFFPVRSLFPRPEIRSVHLAPFSIMEKHFVVFGAAEIDFDVFARTSAGFVERIV